jgi:hypothetical protein
MFKVLKIRITPSFGGEVKPQALWRNILGHIKITCKYEQNYFARQNSCSFPPFLLLATRLITAGRIAREL